jgi:hypothetical protein
MKRIPAAVLFFAVLLTAAPAGPSFAGNGPGKSGRGKAAFDAVAGMENYRTMEKLFLKWSLGLRESRNSRKLELRDHLYGLLGKEIVTEDNFIIIMPGNKEEIEVVCNLMSGKWLHIHGIVDGESLKSVSGEKMTYVSRMWRSGSTVSVRGRIRYYSIGTDLKGDRVDLYLDRIILDPGLKKQGD